MRRKEEGFFIEFETRGEDLAKIIAAVVLSALILLNYQNPSPLNAILSEIDKVLGSMSLAQLLEIRANEIIQPLPTVEIKALTELLVPSSAATAQPQPHSTPAFSNESKMFVCADTKLIKDVPFDQVVWNGRIYAREQWVQVRQWACLIEEFLNVDYGQGTGKEILERFGGDIYDILALIWKESNGRTDAVGKADERGPMQVTPSDGKGVLYKNEKGEPLFGGRPTRAQLEDPRTNIEWGVKILIENILEEGSLEEGIRGYNGCQDCDYAKEIIWLADQIRGH